MTLLPHELVETAANPNATVIWLHGLGADGNDFKPIVPELRLPESAAIRFIFPHAPSMPVTINNGFVMPAWYDILAMNIEREVDEVQLRTSADWIDAFIEAELAKGIATERIVIAGFSQGGAVALEVALRSQHKLAGLMALSTYFATVNTIELSEANRQLPVSVQHGNFDPVVPINLGFATEKFLKEQGYPVEFKSYGMEHSVCPLQIKDIADWLTKVLSL
ncbi:MAG: dienelactone hydrolase family protein [Kangiellaceae bacterium]|jgi:phospholipase/carboxylesterase|nr:dienelactone hydrolase family protein [Kangiellaceae bacterium]